MKNINRFKAFVFASVLILLCFPSVIFAQDLPCEGGDPFSSPCPLDTWVIVLAVIAAVFAGIHLYRKQKAGQSTSR
jgi:hypothetical protein